MNRTEEMDVLYDRALVLEEKGNFSGALVLFKRGAGMNDDGAMNAIGLAYDSGAGVKQNKNQAILWFKKAWRTGKQSHYCMNIAMTYSEIEHHRQAMYWWNKAIGMGDGSAALSLAKYLLKSKRDHKGSHILSTLRMAIDCEESWQISPNEKEEAQKLLKKLTSSR